MLELGQIVQDRYRVDELLGKGGMGAVYRAYDLRLDTTVAIKENLEFDERGFSSTRPMEPDTNSPGGRRAQFEREAKMLARLRHPGLPSVTDHFVVPGKGQYLVMEFVHGKNLLEILAERGRFDVADALQIAIDACRVMEYLHGQTPPIIHRDIKPANLRLTPQGRVIVVDFGIAKEGSAELTQTGALGVTPGFSPMEQYAGSGQTDARSDVYALGATLYALLSDESPPAATARALGAPVIPLTEKITGVGHLVQAALDRAMSFEPKDRFSSAAAFREALESALAASIDDPHTAPSPRQGITAPIAPEGRSSDAHDAQGRRGGGFESGGTDAASSGLSSRTTTSHGLPPTAPVTPSDLPRRSPGESLSDPVRNVPGSTPANARSSAPGTGPRVGAPTTRDRVSPLEADHDRGNSRRRIAAGSIAILVLLLIGAIGYAAYRSGYLPWGGSKPGPAAAWSAIEIHLLDDSNDAASASTLLDRIDERSGPVANHAAVALLSDRELARELFDGERLASLARSRADLPCGRTFHILATGISTDGASEELGSASLESDPCADPGANEVARLDAPSEETPRTGTGAEGVVRRDDPAVPPSSTSGPGAYPDATPGEITRREPSDESVRSGGISGETTPTRTPTDPPTGGTPSEPGFPHLDPVRVEAAEPKSGTVVDLRWSKSPSASFLGYDVHLSTTPDFPPSTTKTQTVSGIDRTSIEWTDLACNTTYYARVVVRDTHGQSAASAPGVVQTPACALPNPVRVSATGGDFSDLITAFERINQDSNVPTGLRVELAPGTYTLGSDLWLGKSVVLVGGSQAILRGRIVTQAARIEIIGVTIESTGKSALNVPSGEVLVRDCVIHSQTHPGVEVLGSGSLEMRNTTIRDCGSKGLLMRDRARVVMQGGAIEGNQSGIDVGGQSELRMNGTAVTRSVQSGIYLHDTGSAWIDRGTIGGNAFNGILIATGARLELTGASVRENQRAGIVVEAGGTATLRDCDLTGNIDGSLVEDPGSQVTREGEVRTR